jgi:hypothetical protein
MTSASLATRRSGEFWRQLVTWAFSVLAAVRFTFSIGDGWSLWRVVAIVVIVMVGLALAWFIWLDERRRSPVVAAPPDQLEAANKRWLAEQGRVLIVTRDMTWSFGNDVREALLRKAQSGELTIYASRQTEELTDLQRAGATVRIAAHVPKVRFTILRRGASDERVLVHRQRKGVVEFFEVHPGDFPAYGLTQDLVELLEGGAP